MSLKNVEAYRLIPTKYPTISVFEDVANEQDFEALYELQARTNPRLRNEAGEIELVKTTEIPFHCKRNRSFAVAPFTHVNPDGSRFSDGSFGMLYLADTDETALKEVMHHQQRYFSNVKGLHFERLTQRLLIFSFNDSGALDVTDRPMSDDIYRPDDYAESQRLGKSIKANPAYAGIRYCSVRNRGAMCWAMSTPSVVMDVKQSKIIELIWDGERLKHSLLSSLKH